MNRSRKLVIVWLAAGAILLGPATAIARADAAAQYTGSLPDGATWIADVPANWNGTLLLYSHGYNPTPQNPARDAPDPATAAALMARGYALAGSSYSRPGFSNGTPAQDQLDTLAAVTQLIGRPRRAIAYGTSFGGMVTGQLAERGGRRLDGALATCGIMGGIVDLHNYQLDGAHAIARLLLGSDAEPVKLVHYTDPGDAATAASRMIAALQQAQSTPDGRARTALITALYQEPTWAPGANRPGPFDFEAQQTGEAQNLLSVLFFTILGRWDLEQNAGGNPSFNRGVDYRQLLLRSGRLIQVATLYHRAGLNLWNDLKLLTDTADVTADPSALEWTRQQLTLTGRLSMPVLTLHTTDDPLVPVQHEEEYLEDATRAGSRGLLAQAYTRQVGHCAFTTAELVAGVETIRQRIETGRWADLAEPRRLQALADSLNLGPANFTSFRPLEFIGDRDRLHG
jgi:pimeloyl-ACP methyl ester carboxylesterase